MSNLDGRSLTDLGFDVEAIHQATRAENTKSHAALRMILPVQNRLDIGNTRALVRYADVKDLRSRRWIENKLRASAARITEGVSRQLRYCGRNSSLILAFESQ